MKLNTMLMLTALATGGVFACSSAFGQDAATNAPMPAISTNTPPHTPHMFRGPSIDRLAQELNLTDAQKQQVQSLLVSERQQMRDLHQDTSLSMDERRSKMKGIHDDMNTKMQSILTPDQYVKWQNLTHAHHTPPRPMLPVSTNSPAGSAQ